MIDLLVIFSAIKDIHIMVNQYEQILPFCNIIDECNISKICLRILNTNYHVLVPIIAMIGIII